jgi:hypothetical protein
MAGFRAIVAERTRLLEGLPDAGAPGVGAPFVSLRTMLHGVH